MFWDDFERILTISFLRFLILEPNERKKDIIARRATGVIKLITPPKLVETAQDLFENLES